MIRQQKGFAVLEAILIVVVLVIIGGTGYFVWHSRQVADKTLTDANKSTTAGIKKSAVNSFEGCKKLASSKILETYPEQCVTSDGKTFTQEASVLALANGTVSVTLPKKWVAAKQESDCYTPGDGPVKNCLDSAEVGLKDKLYGGDFMVSISVFANACTNGSQQWLDSWGDNVSSTKKMMVGGMPGIAVEWENVDGISGDNFVMYAVCNGKTGVLFDTMLYGKNSNMKTDKSVDYNQYAPQVEQLVNSVKFN